MLENIRERRLSYWEIIHSSLLIYRRNFKLFFALDLLLFVTWNLIPTSLATGDLSIIGNLFYGCLIGPALIIIASYLIKSKLENSTIVYSDIWEMCRIKIALIVNVQLLIVPWMIIALLISFVAGLIIHLVMLHVLKINSLLFLFNIFSLTTVLFMVGGFALLYFCQHGVMATVLNNKRGVAAFRYSIELVKVSPWQSFIALCISLFSYLGISFISNIVSEYLIWLEINYLYLWIYAFLAEVLSTIILLTSIIIYLNIDYAYQRRTNLT